MVAPYLVAGGLGEMVAEVWKALLEASEGEAVRREVEGLGYLVCGEGGGEGLVAHMVRTRKTERATSGVKRKSR